MRVLVIGAGGREHAICWKLAQSSLLSELYCAPGNPGIASCANLVPIPAGDVNQLVGFARSNAIDLTIVGPEQPLTLGVVDAFKKEGLKIFGPDQECARLEGSKKFAKEVMESAGVATAGWQSFTNRVDAMAYLKKVEPPIVLKADGLAAGKGVFVCHSRDEINLGVEGIFDDLCAKELVVEQFLDGVEASLIVAVGDGQVVPLASSHDYKRLLPGDHGPNTGGMGSVCPTPRLTQLQEQQAIELIIKPVLEELRRRGLSFSGFLYAGLMISKNSEIQVLEFNVRLGDPEAQAILRRLDSDLLELISSLIEKKPFRAQWSSHESICVVLAGKDYPRSSSCEIDILGLADADQIPGVVVFQAGTAAACNGSIVTNGGRILNVTAKAENFELARQRAFEAVKLIKFAGLQYRDDIGRDG